MSVSAVPAGTVKLRIKMVDLNAPGYVHGGGTVAFSGNVKSPYGAFCYQGPCTPNRHIYQVTVEAPGPDGKVLAKATARKPLP